jgi:hypothetical protein
LYLASLALRDHRPTKFFGESREKGTEGFFNYF